MPKVCCPFCKNEVEINNEKFPRLACDTELTDCPECGEEIELSWYAVFDASRPTPRAADAASLSSVETTGDNSRRG
jgi:hypothetical protein